MRGLPEHGHDPVMVGEVMGFLDPRPGQVMMDCTAGRGGHALEIARRLSPGGTIIALDVDPENLKYTRKRFDDAGIDSVTLRTFHANFAEAADVLAELEIAGVNGLLADFGVSTNQLTEASHGLSFSAEAPLDMRLDPRIRKKASDLLNELDEKQIADILYHNAQERFAYKIARKIVQTRATQPILTTEQLARLVRSVIPPSRTNWGQIDPATRTFQALRMAVNSELESLEDLLATVPQMLLPGGAAVFISFHSGEDRLVKQATRQWDQEGLCDMLTKKPLEPSDAEMQHNPRSRSAKVRAVRRTAVEKIEASKK
jgi:16S rRNA (cytosine1402-N4)-methyltransferase